MKAFLLALGLTVMSTLSLPATGDTNVQDTMLETIDRQDIEYLRRLYGKATDLIGTGNAGDLEAGRAIYHRIFTPDAEIRTIADGKIGLTATGPDGWVDVVEEALSVYVSTQHLIGTQLVDINGDEAHMESYLNAWHERPTGVTYIFIGTYEDKVRKTETGWQIYDMTLHQVSSGEVKIRE